MGGRGRYRTRREYWPLRLTAIALPGILMLATLSQTAFAKTYEPTVDTVIETHGHTKYTLDALIDIIVKK